MKRVSFRVNRVPDFKQTCHDLFTRVRLDLLLQEEISVLQCRKVVFKFNKRDALRA
jgi:hypothetical protein